ncbi:MAG: hypothetical protein ABIV25_12785 [Paracoccaceae bacterium]
MIRFAAMLAALPRDQNALPIYLQTAPETDRDACLTLLNGNRPHRIATLNTITQWAADAAAIPDWLFAASLAASGDKSETAALILPPPIGTPPTLAELLHALATATPITAHATLIALWSRLPADARRIVNRLASGTFRTSLPTAPPSPSPNPQTILAVMTLVQPAIPEITLALWHDGIAIPIARVLLTLQETAEVLAWTRTNTTNRFGPISQVPPTLVFELSYDGTTPNRRRKSGLDLINPRLIALHRDAVAAELHQLAQPFLRP